MTKLNTHEDFNNNSKTNTNDNSLILSFYLLKHCKLWVWDFDDTLIDTKYYYKSNMDPDAIRCRTDQQLTNEVPQWRYFKNLVSYLVQSGKYIAIASFGTYEIIKAYMDRIMGFNQTFFTNKNLIAPNSQERTKRCFKIPPNKNEYIYKIMKHYKIEDFKRVVLFDDLASNIADAIGIGIIAIQINTPSNGDVHGRCGGVSHASGGISSSGMNMFFGPWVMEMFDKKIENDYGKELYLNRTYTGITNNSNYKKLLAQNYNTIIDTDTNTNTNTNIRRNILKNTRSKYNHNKINASCYKGMSYDKIDFKNDVEEIFNPVVFGTAIGNRKISTNSEYRWNKMNVANPPKFINGNWENSDTNLDTGNTWADSTLGGQSLSFWDKKHIVNKKKGMANAMINDPDEFNGITEGFQNVSDDSHDDDGNDDGNDDCNSHTQFEENDKFIMKNKKNKKNMNMNMNNSESCKPFKLDWIILVLILIVLMMIIIIYNAYK